MDTPHAAPRATGLHTLVVVLYLVLSLAALGRSGYQIATRFEEAPLAYSLSGLAAVMYVVATTAIIAARNRVMRRVATVAVSLEALGVLTIGALSLLRPELFPDATVWSGFGAGYVYIPLVLPFVGLWWMLRLSRSEKAVR